MEVHTGKDLSDLLEAARPLKPRSQLPAVSAYMSRHPMGRVLVLRGLPRTGRTTLMLHAMASLPPQERESCAYLDIVQSDQADDALADMERLHDAGIKSFFLDGLADASGFLGSARVFADGMAMRGMHVVISGNAFSLSMALSDQLFMKARIIDASRLSFQEAAQLAGMGLGTYLEGGSLGALPDEQEIIDGILQAAAQCRGMPACGELHDLLSSGRLEATARGILRAPSAQAHPQAMELADLMVDAGLFMRRKTIDLDTRETQTDLVFTLPGMDRDKSLSVRLGEAALINRMGSGQNAFAVRFEGRLIPLCIQEREDGRNGVSVYMASAGADPEIPAILEDRGLLSALAGRFRRVRERGVMYLGPDAETGGIHFINAAGFLG